MRILIVIKVGKEYHLLYFEEDLVLLLELVLVLCYEKVTISFELG